MPEPRKPGTIRVMLVDDHRSVLWGLQRLIDGEMPRMHVVATAHSQGDAVAQLAKQEVDVILLDLDLGATNGIDAIPLLMAHSKARILILTGMRDRAMHDRAVLAGACGVIGKEDPAETILKAIVKAFQGELWLDREATGRIFVELSRRTSDAAAEDPVQARLATLTARERHIVAEMASDAGATARAIASKLCISEHTLRNHLTSIYDKLGVSSRLELWAFANKHGLQRKSA
jgi:two-component system nitrate/nitrite response regulator NarL